MASSTLLDNVLKSPALVLETFGETETEELAKQVGGLLKAGDWICLLGDLGAGKTVFVRGIGAALHCVEPVRSPTFALIQSYKTRMKGIKHLNHVDLYRLESKEISTLELDGFIDGSDVTVVEWAEKARSFWPASGCVVRIKHEGLDRRQLEFFPLDARWMAQIKQLKGRLN